MSELKLQQCRLDNRYDISECLGRGSYAEVYVARDVTATNGHPSVVVIKALNVFLQGSIDEELERTLIDNFRNEALALDLVRHPNIISRLGHGTAIDLAGRAFHYIVLEYLSGGDLERLCRQHPLPLEQSLFFLEQVARGLAYAHEHHVIHRDIKPQNLLLTTDQRTIKIADFGVAKIEAREGAMITRVGTDVYAAPEHHPLANTGSLEPANLTPAADVYSLAKTAYRLITGETPRRFSLRPIEEFPAETANQPWAEATLRVLRRATQTDARARPQTVTEFWEELRAAVRSLKTQPLYAWQGKGANEELKRELSQSERTNGEGRAHATAPPPAPAPQFVETLVNTAELVAQARARHRIVVPVTVAPDAKPQLPVALPHAPIAAPLPTSPSRKSAATSRAAIERAAQSQQSRENNAPALAGRARKWLVAVMIISLFTAMLYATHKYAQHINLFGWGTATTTTSPDSPVNREFVSTTDVNLRPAPRQLNTSIGMVEQGSRVRVLSVDGNWSEVQVIEHGRAKSDATSADRGWVNKMYFSRAG